MNYRFSTHDSHSELCDAIRLVNGPFREKWGYFLRAESFYTVATQEELYAKFGPGAQSEHYHRQSHGESFLSLAQNHFKPNGLYFLDEPEATIYEFDDGPLHETIYEETESYQITEMFINNREGVLRHMLAE